MDRPERKQNPHSRKLTDYKKKTRADANATAPHHNTTQTLKKLNTRSHRRALDQTLLVSQSSTHPMNEEEAWLMEEQILSTDQIHHVTPPPRRVRQVSLEEHIHQVKAKKQVKK